MRVASALTVLVLVAMAALLIHGFGSGSTASLAYIFVPLAALALIALVWTAALFGLAIRRTIREWRDWHFANPS